MKNEFIKHSVASEMDNLKDWIETQLEANFKDLEQSVQVNIIKFAYQAYALGKDNMTQFMKEEIDKLCKMTEL